MQGVGKLGDEDSKIGGTMTYEVLMAVSGEMYISSGAVSFEFKAGVVSPKDEAQGEVLMRLSEAGIAKVVNEAPRGEKSKRGLAVAGEE